MLNHDEARAIIHRVPGWEGVEVANLRSLEGGLTNQSFVFEVGGEPFVLRVNGENSQSIGINRAAEFAAMSEASRAGLAPEVICFFADEGHLVRRFNTGTEWDSPDLAQPEAMRRAVETLRQAHQLGPIAFEFSPFRDIERRLRILRELPVDLPDDSPAFVARACEIETRFWRKPHSDSGLCHNDPFASNFIVTANSAQLIDWEFAGMGDVFYDLACVSVYYPAENHHHVLQWYFGEVRPNGLEKLKAIRWVMHLWNWTWAVLQVHNAGAQQEHVELEKNLLNAVRSGMRD